MKTNQATSNTSVADKNNKNSNNNEETNNLQGWRDLIDFVEHNRLPRLPGLDTTAVSELLGQALPANTAGSNFTKNNLDKSSE